MIEVSTVPPRPGASRTAASRPARRISNGATLGGGFYPPLPGGPRRPRRTRLRRTAREGTRGFDQSALQALLQSVQSGAPQGSAERARPRARAATAATAAGRQFTATAERRPTTREPRIGAGMSSRSYSQSWTAAGAGRRRSGRRRRSRARGDRTRPRGRRARMPGGNGLCAFFNTPRGAGGATRAGSGTRGATRAAARSVSQSKVLNDERATPEVFIESRRAREWTAALFIWNGMKRLDTWYPERRRSETCRPRG